MAANITIPGVRQSWAGSYGWSYNGGPRKMILHSTESDTAPGCVDQLCHYLDGWANPTVVWDPWTGDMAMCGRADWAGGALKAGNRDGSVVLQVEAVGHASGYSPELKTNGWRPFTDSPMLGWTTILDWTDSWGIPHVMPAGPPMAYPAAAGYDNGNRPGDTWQLTSGFYSHSQVPGNDHGDPGLVDLAKLFPAGPQEDEVSALPTIGAHDVGHPKSVALLKQLLKDINPGADVSTIDKFDAAIKGFQSFFKVTGGADGIAGPATWRALLSAATGGGR